MLFCIQQLLPTSKWKLTSCQASSKLELTSFPDSISYCMDVMIRTGSLLSLPWGSAHAILSPSSMSSSSSHPSGGSTNPGQPIAHPPLNLHVWRCLIDISHSANVVVIAQAVCLFHCVTSLTREGRQESHFCYWEHLVCTRPSKMFSWMNKC